MCRGALCAACASALARSGEPHDLLRGGNGRDNNAVNNDDGNFVVESEKRVLPAEVGTLGGVVLVLQVDEGTASRSVAARLHAGRPIHVRGRAATSRMIHGRGRGALPLAAAVIVIVGAA